MNNLFQGYELKKRFNSETEPRLSDKKAPPHPILISAHDSKITKAIIFTSCICRYIVIL